LKIFFFRSMIRRAPLGNHSPMSPLCKTC
jgi:hypothetical protein